MRALRFILCVLCVLVLVGQFLLTPTWKFISFYTNWFLMITTGYTMFAVYLQDITTGERSIEMLALHHLLQELTLWGQVLCTLVWWLMIYKVAKAHPDYQNPWRFRFAMCVHSVPLMIVAVLFLASPMQFVDSHAWYHALILWVF